MEHNTSRLTSLATVRSQDGTLIAFEPSGYGEPVVLVSGASTSRSVHNELAALLATDFTVMNYDRRGRGDSGDTPPYAIEREIEDLAAVLAATSGHAAVFGNSSGAVLALRAAAAGLPIRRLALWEPPFMVDSEALRRAQTYAARLNELLTADRRGDAIALFLSSVGLPEQMIAGMRNSPTWPVMEAIAPTLAYDAAVMGDNSVPDEVIAGVSIPTLVLTGDRTGPWADAAAGALTRVMPTATHRVLADQTHAVAWDVLAAELKPYLGGAD